MSQALCCVCNGLSGLEKMRIDAHSDAQAEKRSRDHFRKRVVQPQKVAGLSVAGMDLQKRFHRLRSIKRPVFDTFLSNKPHIGRLTFP